MVAITHNKVEAPLPSPYRKMNDAKIEFQLRLVHENAWQCCLNCEEWSDGSGQKHKGVTAVGCTLHKALPPPDVIVTGCNDHMIDLPF